MAEPEHEPASPEEPPEERQEEPVDEFRCPRFCRLRLDVRGRLDFGAIGNHTCKIRPFLDPGDPPVCWTCMRRSTSGRLFHKAPEP